MLEDWVAYGRSLATWLWYNQTQWLLPIAVLLLMCVLVILIHQQSPRYREKWMARKKERETIADIVQTALDTALEQDRISPSQRLRYQTRLAKGLDLPDLLPRRIDRKIINTGTGERPVWVSIPIYNAQKLASEIRKRLSETGGNIAERLRKMRRSRTTQSKRQKVVSAVRPK